MRTHTALAASALIATATCAGPLAPPNGPPAPTYKTLDQIKPGTPVGPETTPGDAGAIYRITQPGAYYLTENLLTSEPKHGIEILAPNVLLDLNGFTISGTGEPTTRDGVRAAGLVDITVANGKITAFGDDGVDVQTSDRAVLRDLVVSGNNDYGVRARHQASLHRVAATDNGDDGILAEDDALIVDCLAERNGGDGFRTSARARFARVRSTGNTSAGYVSLAFGARLDACISYDNGTDGFRIHGGANVLTDCVSRDDDEDGFEFVDGYYNTLTRCMAQWAGGHGFILRNSATLTDCTASDCAGDGFMAEFGATLSGCRAQFNDGRGYNLFSSAQMTGCRSGQNQVGDDLGGAANVRECFFGYSGPGFSVTVRDSATIERCLISGFQAGLSAGSRGTFRDNEFIGRAEDATVAIQLTGNDNRVAHNRIHSTSQAVTVPGSNNTVVANHVTDGSLTPAPGNRFGPVVNATGVDDLATLPFSDHPLANLVH